VGSLWFPLRLYPPFRRRRVGAWFIIGALGLLQRPRPRGAHQQRRSRSLACCCRLNATAPWRSAGPCGCVKLMTQSKFFGILSSSRQSRVISDFRLASQPFVGAVFTGDPGRPSGLTRRSSMVLLLAGLRSLPAHQAVRGRGRFDGGFPGLSCSFSPITLPMLSPYNHPTRPALFPAARMPIRNSRPSIYARMTQGGSRKIPCPGVPGCAPIRRILIQRHNVGKSARRLSRGAVGESTYVSYRTSSSELACRLGREARKPLVGL